jgi:hypothetical protein
MSKAFYNFDQVEKNVFIGKTGDLGLSGKSFSFMCWIRLNDVSNGDQFDQTIVGQRNCHGRETLHMVIRNLKPYFGFFGMDTGSATTLSLFTWYHLAFVYNITSQTQSIYINGKLDVCSGPCILPLQGNHHLFYSLYCLGRPLNGFLAAPLFRSQNVKEAELDVHIGIRQHMLEYSMQQAQNHQMELKVITNKNETKTSWPPAKLAINCMLPRDALLAKRNDEFLPFLEETLASDVTIVCNN